MGREYPAGPKINFLLAIIGQMLPKLFPFDPLAFALENARQFGDIAYYRVGPLRVYQLNSPELIRQILVERPEKLELHGCLASASRFSGARCSCRTQPGCSPRSTWNRPRCCRAHGCSIKP